MTQDVATAANPDTRSRRRRRVILLIAIAAVLVVAISLVAVSCLSNKAATPPTVRVDRGTVALAVNASGNITPSGQQSLGFANGGTVSQLLVKVGDRVTPGQTLARIDDTNARQTLVQKQAALDQQIATLQKLQGAVSVSTAQASLSQARDTEAKTQSQVNATNAANRSATSRARTQLQFDQSSLNRAQQQLSADRSACASSPRTTTPTTPTTVAGAPATVPTTAAPPGAGVGTTTGIPTNPVPTSSRGAPGTSTGTAPGGGGTTITRTVAPTMTMTVAPTRTTAPTTLRTVTTRVSPIADTTSLGGLNSDIDNADGRTGPACSRLLSDRQAVQQAQGTVVSSRTALDSAQQREKTDATAGQVSLSNARNSVVSAQNQLDTANNDSPKDIAAQADQVRNARADVALAQKTLDQTVITAPVAGTITAINGVAGEVVTAPSAVTPLAPGGTAPLPQSSGGTGTGTGSTASTPGAGAFVVLDAADPFQLVVPFEEADAARIAPGQQVDVSVDALPDDRLTGDVTSVAPAGQVQSGIVNYYATVVVQGGADRLRSGQTAEANVRVESVDNVLRVPASAVRREDGRPTVTVTGPDGKPVAMPFLAGLVGDDYVEVRSGLTDGDQVELPQATVTAAPSPGGPPRSN